MTPDEALAAEFAQECRERLQAIAQVLDRIDRGAGTGADTVEIRRHFHSIKGAATFAGAGAIARLAHEVEDRLASADGAPASPSLLGSAWEGHDAIHAALDAIAGTSMDSRAAVERPPPGHDTEAAGASDRTEHVAASPTDSMLRVKLEKLDHLVELASELVVVRNQVGRWLSGVVERATDAQAAGDLGRAYEQLSRITRELEQAVMDTRLVEIRALVQDVPRQVRGLATRLEKRVRCDIRGAGIALDKSVIDRLRVPIAHLVRNACDHGIETPAQRQALGKPAEGVIRIDTIQEENWVRIRFQDDGAGIDPRAVIQCARERGLVTALEAERLPPERALSLVFEPGFSSKKSVTETSGRGIGLDVVRHEVEALNGTVTLETSPGAGTCFELRLPLSLFVVPALRTRIHGQPCAVPIANVVEVARWDREAVESLGGGTQILHRDRIYPLLRLSGLLLAETEPATGAHGCPYFLVVAHLGRHAVLPVDALAGQEDLVVRNPGGSLQAIPGTRGLSILGDGAVVPVLDIGALFDAARSTAAKAMAEST